MTPKNAVLTYVCSMYLRGSKKPLACTTMKCTIIRDIYVVKFCKWQHEVTTIFFNLAAADFAAIAEAIAADANGAAATITASAASIAAAKAAGSKLSSFRFII